MERRDEEIRTESIHRPFDWELETARGWTTVQIKNAIWMASIGNAIPGCISVEALRAVLAERGEEPLGYHDS